ncbi:MAG: DUF3267 domain-containing protein [Ruminococcaceae bacterium]|nr:DUF3267 domain-containing protein [Oscillospiraceae bacterium]
MRYALNLPENYREIEAIDLQNNKKQLLWVNGVAFVIMLAMVIPAAFLVPISTIWGRGEFQSITNTLMPLLKLGVTLAALVVYIILHELVHGICMKAIAKRKPTYGFTGLYAFTASDAYFGRAAYIFIALAPVVLWGVVLAVLLPFVPISWFWVVYFIQIQNISGAAGDIYVTCRLMKMPKDILVFDFGTAMKVYSKEI